MFEILFPALLTGILLSLITAPLGVFVVWRKMAYFGDTLSHSALLGVALGIFLQVNPYIAIVVLTLILAIAMVWLESNTQFSIDTLLGIIAHSCLSLGVVTVGLLRNVRVDLMNYLFGDLLAINYTDLIYIGIGVIIVLSTLIYFWQSLLSTTVSPELAQVEGINIKKNAFYFDDINRIDYCLEYEICRCINNHILIKSSQRQPLVALRERQNLWWAGRL
ncbi:zinc transporter subunit: membrane component of ABC superfamily [Haemophilus influenzae]|uniref:High-affinity zinc uptake system membrane protein ZnuB n=1 Tax=Haemophilus influenzae TaxID=727 RepID=A0A2X1RIG5_HAEIF|nr:zinc transporter subunit: membrane component of ABC superfamily [Haemophilus influenzae]